MFEILPHTADIGFRARGCTLEELFEAAAEALSSLAFETSDISPRESYSLSAEGDDLEELLVNWLSEILFWMDGKRVAMRQFRVERISQTQVTGKGFGAPRTPDRPRPKLLVKGITFHQLRILQEPGGFSAQVFVDI